MAEKRDFTDRFLKAIKPAAAGKRDLLFDAQVPGFGIRVTDKSTKSDIGSFVLVSRYPGSSNPTARRIGDYPAMSLAEGRQKAREWRDDIARGIDPKVKEAERQREEQRRRADTFGAIFEQFAADHLTTLRTGKQVEASVTKHALPAWRDRPITDIRRADINELIRKVRADAPIAANRLLAFLKKFFGWVVDQDLLEASPAAAVKRLSKETKRDRVLTEDEIRAFWLGCDELGTFGTAFKLMLVTAQRRNEVGGMAWSEVDEKRKNWTLSRERTKADRAHEVPLSALACELIESCPRLGKYVLATGRGLSTTSGGTPLAGWSKAKARLDDLAAAHYRTIIGDDAAGLPAWHLHDLRRTAATYLAQGGADRVTISKILNHADPAVTGIYDRFSYDTQKRGALDGWGERLRDLIDGAPNSSNVVRFATGRTK